MTAMANYNMSFDKGSFKKNNIYKYRKDPHERLLYLITTEEGREQELWWAEFDTLFTILKN